jgi:hypothetical protein
LVGAFERAYYQDSENDLIDLSDDEDFKNAHRYQKQKNTKELKVSVRIKREASNEDDDIKVMSKLSGDAKAPTNEEV